MKYSDILIYKLNENLLITQWQIFSSLSVSQYLTNNRCHKGIVPSDGEPAAAAI